jgi:hypothetical protein
MREEDILFWPDGYWCYRCEVRRGWTRDYEYRVIPYQSEQWQILSRWPQNLPDVSLRPPVSHALISGERHRAQSSISRN